MTIISSTLENRDRWIQLAKERQAGIERLRAVLEEIENKAQRAVDDDEPWVEMCRDIITLCDATLVK